MPELFPIGLPEQIACLEREVALRRRVHPRWVAAGKMSQAKADKEIAAMEAALETLCRLAIESLKRPAP